jgi:hypothetical protein
MAGFFPSLSLSWNKQIIFAGPSVVFYDAQHPQPLSGAQAGYRIFPNGRNKKFNLFFEYNINYVNGKIKDNIGYPWDDFSGGYKSVTQSRHVVSLDNYFGFGFRWNIFRNFYLSSNIGAGVGLYKEDYTYSYLNGPTWGSKGNLAFRDPIGSFNRLFKIGIGYDLVNFKKKNRVS